MTRISSRDWEALSAYLDGQLAPKERSRLEKKLQASADLRAAMEELRRTRAVLRSQPRLRAPRNFTLTPEMAGLRKPASRSAPFSAYFGLASALASALFVVVLLVDLLGGTRMAAPMAKFSSTQAVALQEAPSGERAASEEVEAPAAEAPSPAIEMAAPAQEESQSPTPTGELLEALEAVDPTLEAEMQTETATAPGAGEMPAQQATPAAVVPEGYPAPLLETDTGLAGPASEPLLPAPTDTPPAIPTPAPAGSIEDEAPAYPPAGSQAADQAFEPASPVVRTTLRLLEIGLALLAIGAGLVWFFLRRAGQP
jgi:hypothetical protein